MKAPQSQIDALKAQAAAATAAKPGIFKTPVPNAKLPLNIAEKLKANAAELAKEQAKLKPIQTGFAQPQTKEIPEEEQATETEAADKKKTIIIVIVVVVIIAAVAFYFIKKKNKK